MTTTVTINAHLATSKEVKVLIRSNISGIELESFTLQDGEKADRYVYDDREIVISEVEK